MVSYVWSLRYVTGDPATGVIKRAGFLLTGTAPDGRSYSRYDDVSLPAVAPTDPQFIPINKVTPDMVIGWMQTQYGDAQVALLKQEFETALAPALAPELAGNEPLTGMLSAPVAVDASPIALGT